jgi:N-methylhydantoinase B
MHGGEDAPPHLYKLRSKGRKPRTLKTKEVGIVVRPGDVFEVRSGGGGGWGAPQERTPQARAQDEMLGFVTKGAR